MAKTATQVATANQNKALVAASMYEDDANTGFEEADRDAYAIPFLTILQSSSPQCKKSDGAYIKGAEEGMLYNTVSQQVYKGEEGIEIIPVHYKRAFIEWKPRDSGGGFVAEHNAADGQDLLRHSVRDDKGHDMLPNGNLLSDTRSHYVIILHADGTFEPAVIAMTSTQMKKSRRWMTVMQNRKMVRADGTPFTPPMFSHKYRASTVPESNDQGSWFGWKLTTGEQLSDVNLYAAAKQFRDAIVSGEVKTQQPIEASAAAGTPEEF